MRRLGRYRRWSIRVSSLTLAQVKHLAVSEGWEISDLTRALVVLAAAATWLALEHQKNLDILRGIAALGGMPRALGERISRGEQRRPYAVVRGSRDTDVMTLILPANIAELLESFAAAKMVSKNELCGGLLTKGLIIYLTAKKRLLQTLQTLRRQTEEGSEPK